LRVSDYCKILKTPIFKTIGIIEGPSNVLNRAQQIGDPIEKGAEGCFLLTERWKGPVHGIMRECAVAVDFGAGKRASAACARASILTNQPRVSVRPSILRLGDTNVADNDKPWQDMNPDEQAVLIRQISGAVNGLQFRVQDLEESVKALQEKLKKP
jgi:hypothetical protein